MIRGDLPSLFRRASAAVGFAGILSLSFAFSPAFADGAALTGAWSGTGSIAFASGSKERAHCRAHFAKTGETSYEMAASCATSSAKVDQSAQLTKTGANSYVGSFFNQQYNTGGSIRITVSGRSGSVKLSGEAGTAVFSLKKL